MKKIGLLALAIVLSLGLVGAGFAQWTETLNIDADVDTGELDVEFRAYLGVEWSPYVTLSPWIEFWWPGSGVTSHTFTLNGVYPSFGSGGIFSQHRFWVMYTAKNVGTIPAKVASVDIDAPGWLDVHTYSEGVPDWVKEEAIAQVENSAEIPEEEKVEIIQAIEDDWSVGDILGTKWYNRTGCIFLKLHVDDTAEHPVPEGGSGTVTVETVFTQFNA